MRWFGVAFFILILVSCQEPPAVIPLADHGVIDLRQWDFDRHPTIDLKGRWEFWWDELSTTPGTPPLFLVVPGRWEQLTKDGRPLPKDGQGTYRLAIRLPSGLTNVGLRIPPIEQRYRLWVDGVERTPGRVADHAVTSYVFVQATEPTLTLLFQVQSRVGAWSGGIHDLISLGPTAAIAELKGLRSAYELFLVGSLLLMGLYHLMLFWIERRDPALLLFALICWAAAWRQMSVDEFYLLRLVGTSGEWMFRMAWVTPYLLCVLFAGFFHHFFLKAQLPKTCLGLVAYGSTMGLLCWFGPLAVVSSPWLQQTYVVATVLYVFVIMGRALFFQERHSLVLLLGTTFIAAPAIVDIFTTNATLLPVSLFPLGLIPFLITFAYALAQRYTQGTREAEGLRVKNSKLAELDEAKTHFFANISHELRTPLTLIQGPLEGIQKGEFGAVLPPSHPVFRLMRTNTARILKLIENLLKVTRWEAGAPSHPQVLDVVTTLAGYLAVFEVSAKDKGLKLVFEPRLDRPWVVIDPQDLETVVFNLLSNAVKYTPPGGTVTVTLDQSSPTHWRLQVRDTGIGISPDQQGRIFGRFQRVYEVERARYEGTGLGLAIVRECVSRLGGEIRLTSSPAQGSMFTVDFPWTKPPTDGPSLVAEPSKHAKNQVVSDLSALPAQGLGLTEGSSTKRGHLLVVEDNEDLRQYLTAFLERDFIVVTAPNGLRALERLEKASFDLIISDVMMPEMDGFTFHDRVLERPGARAIPFLFLTARATEDRWKRMEKGALDYLLKPFSPDELRAKVHAILDHQRRLQEALESGTFDGRPHPEPALGKRWNLTPREETVVDHFLAGKSDDVIGRELDLSATTVAKHLASVLEKTGLTARSELMDRGLKGEFRRGRRQS